MGRRSLIYGKNLFFLLRKRPRAPGAFFWISVYTEGFDDVASADQFQEMFRIKPNDQVQVEYFGKAEHTFPLTQNRKALCERIQQWYCDRFSSVAAITK